MAAKHRATATVLTGNETGSETILGVEGQTTWYVVNSNITYTAAVKLDGNTTIILANGCTMSIGEDADGKRINDYGIFGRAGKALTIYGQSLDDATAGHLKIFTTDSLFRNGISDTRYTQHSGNVTVKATGDTAIDTSYGDITVNGGTLSVTSLENDGIVAYKGYSIIINSGKVNATSNSDSYALWSKSGNVTINGGQVEANGGTGIRADSGNITLGWSRADDYIKASAYNASGVVKIAAGQAFIDEDGNIYSGTYKSIPFDSENQSILFLSANNTLYFPKSGTTINPQRAYFQLKDSTAPVRRFVLNFGDEETTGVVSMEDGRRKMEDVNSEEWYDLNGRKLGTKPTQKGVYVYKGKKRVIK